MRPAVLVAIGICGMVGFFGPTFYGASLRSGARIYENSWASVSSPFPPILVPLEGGHEYILDISFSDYYKIQGNYSIYLDDDLVILQQLDLIAGYDDSSVDISRNYYQTPDHDATLNLSISITSGSACTVRIIKDWSFSSDVWLIIGACFGIGFLIFTIFAYSKVQGSGQHATKPLPEVGQEIPVETAKSAQKACVRCGGSLPVAARWCPRCGRELEPN